MQVDITVTRDEQDNTVKSWQFAVDEERLDQLADVFDKLVAIDEKRYPQLSAILKKYSIGDLL